MACPDSHHLALLGPPSIHAARRRSALTIISLAIALSTAAVAHDQELEGEPQDAAASQHIPCVEGTSGEYSCRNMELVHFVPTSTFGTWSTNDLWGWTDPESGSEYVLLGVRSGTAFIRIDEFGHPTYIGRLPTRTTQSSWRDIKVYRDHAYIVSEAVIHGMQVFDLTRLRDVAPEDMPVVFEADTDYLRFRSAHNVAINEDTGFAYVVGAASCLGGLHMIDIREPKNPQFAGCFHADRYTHDTQCVIYHGPDTDYQGREICFNSNEDTVTIVDVTVKTAPRMIARAPYFGSAYTHQGWLTEDHAYFLLDDEFDERQTHGPTRTFVWDMSDLDAPYVTGVYDAQTTSIDHNQYTLGNHVFQANYRSGIRVLRLGDLSQGELGEVAYFDTTPEDDRPLFSGTWSVYPYFKSGYVVASDIYRGLYVFWPRLDAVSECEDGIDNDGDGLRDHGEDTTCISSKARSESIRFDVDLVLDPRFVRQAFVPGHHDNLKLGIKGSSTVDFRDLELDTLLFHPGDLSPHISSFAKKGADVDGDGFKDLVMSFHIDPEVLTPKHDRVCVTGLLAGDAFESCVELTIATAGALPAKSSPTGGKKVSADVPSKAERNQNKADHPL